MLYYDYVIYIYNDDDDDDNNNTNNDNEYNHYRYNNIASQEMDRWNREAGATWT